MPKKTAEGGRTYFNFTFSPRIKDFEPEAWQIIVAASQSVR